MPLLQSMDMLPPAKEDSIQTHMTYVVDNWNQSWLDPRLCIVQEEIPFSVAMGVHDYVSRISESRHHQPRPTVTSCTDRNSSTRKLNHVTF